MIVERLELQDFRNYVTATFDLTAGTTAVIGDNGQGKTNFAEALAFLATLNSFRRVPTETLIRVGADQAIVRAVVRHCDGREVLVEAEINRSGRNRVQVNRQRLVKSRDLLGVLRVTVFSPDDLVLVKGGPVERRTFLDELLVALRPGNEQLRLDLERILKQRNMLLKQIGGKAGGRLPADVELTLDVWDERLATTGEELGRQRAQLADALGPLVDAAYTDLAGIRAPIGVVYDPPWRRSGLRAALALGRADDLRRQLSLVGPHRDDVELSIGGMPARTHASQGEQRTLALALRLAGHRLVGERTGHPPVLVLDDVLSELDQQRADALLGHLPAGQVVLTTAGVLPARAVPQRIVRIAAGTLA